MPYLPDALESFRKKRAVLDLALAGDLRRQAELDTHRVLFRSVEPSWIVVNAARVESVENLHAVKKPQLLESLVPGGSIDLPPSANGVAGFPCRGNLSRM